MALHYLRLIKSTESTEAEHTYRRLTDFCIHNGFWNQSLMSTEGQLYYCTCDWYPRALCLVAQSCLILCNPMKPSRLLCPWGFSRQEYWSGLPCPSSGDLPNPGI